MTYKRVHNAGSGLQPESPAGYFLSGKAFLRAAARLGASLRSTSSSLGKIKDMLARSPLGSLCDTPWDFAKTIHRAQACNLHRQVVPPFLKGDRGGLSLALQERRMKNLGISPERPSLRIFFGMKPPSPLAGEGRGEGGNAEWALKSAIHLSERVRGIIFRRPFCALPALNTLPLDGGG